MLRKDLVSKAQGPISSVDPVSCTRIVPVGLDRVVILEGGSLEGERCMTATVIKLYSLAYSVGASSQNEDLLVVGGLTLAVAIVAGVHVRCCCLKLSSTGVHPLHCGHDSQLLSPSSHFFWAGTY